MNCRELRLDISHFNYVWGERNTLYLIVTFQTLNPIFEAVSEP